MENIKEEIEIYLFNIYITLKNNFIINIEDLKKIIYIYCNTLNSFEKDLSFKILKLINKNTIIKNEIDYKQLTLIYANNLNNKILGENYYD